MGPGHERTTLSERERRLLDALEATMAREDPDLADRFGTGPSHPRLRVPAVRPLHAAVGAVFGAVVVVATFTFSVVVAFAGVVLMAAAALGGVAWFRSQELHAWRRMRP